MGHRPIGRRLKVLSVSVEPGGVVMVDLTGASAELDPWGWCRLVIQAFGAGGGSLTTSASHVQPEVGASNPLPARSDQMNCLLEVTAE